MASKDISDRAPRTVPTRKLPGFSNSHTVFVAHEYPVAGDVITETVTLETPAPTTTVIFKSAVTAIAGRKQNASPAFLAAQRRHRSAQISRSIQALGNVEDKEDFQIWAHEPLAQIRKLLHFLTDAEAQADPEHEGNSCEILRQLRDSFLRNGWRRYREDTVRAAVVAVVAKLIEADSVTASDASASLASLLDIGLEPGLNLFDFADVT
jgi:hypothetical protein